MKDRKNMKKKSLNYPILPFKSFSNFMVKEQVLFSLSYWHWVHGYKTNELKSINCERSQ